QTKTKKYLTYAIGEVFLIVVGILLAMYINKLNQDYQYRKKIDNNLNRVYTELETNLQKTGRTIAAFQAKDSLIHRFMNDSLKKSDYKENPLLAALIFNSLTLELEEEAYQNLVQLNISDNTYQDTLISSLKEVYSLNTKIKVLNDKSSDFVYNLLLNQNTDVYDRFSYDGTLSDELIHHFLTSKKYRSDVSKYTSLAIGNQLRRYQIFYTAALGVYQKLSEQYGLPNVFESYIDAQIIPQFTGTYSTGQDSTSFDIVYQNDSILLVAPPQLKLHLIPYAKHRLYLNAGGLGYFVAFFPSDTSETEMRIHIRGLNQGYKRIASEE
ncbi:MAG: hypothetical protein AAF135_07535, partial [Bacteroidota bacterium]